MINNQNYTQQLVDEIRRNQGDVTLLGMNDSDKQNIFLQKAQSGELKTQEVLKEKMLSDYNDSADNAQKAIRDVNTFHAAYQRTSALNKGSIFGSLAKFDNDAQEAMKSATRAVFQFSQGLKGFSKVSNLALSKIDQGNLSINLDSRAEKAIYDEIVLNAKREIVTNNLAQQLSTYIRDPNLIKRIVNIANDDYNIIDENGKLYPENLAYILKYSHPEAPLRIGNGKDYLPEDVTDIISFLKSRGQKFRDLRDVSLEKGIPISIAIRRLRENVGESNLKGNANAK